MTPDVGVSSRTRAFAIVDLPQPDSPTMARVPPRGTLNDTSSTARKTSLPVPYSTTRLLTVSRSSAMRGLLHERGVTACRRVCRPDEVTGVGDVAHGIRRRCGGRRIVPGTQLGDRAEQLLGVRVLGVVDDVGDGAALDEDARLHDVDAVAHETCDA